MSSQSGEAQQVEFLPGIILPPNVHGLLRQRLAEIEVSDTTVNCLMAQARAESLVEALEAMKAVSAEAYERLRKIIEHSAGARMEEISSETSP